MKEKAPKKKPTAKEEKEEKEQKPLPGVHRKPAPDQKPLPEAVPTPPKETVSEIPPEEELRPKARARSRSVFAEKEGEQPSEQQEQEEAETPTPIEESPAEKKPQREKIPTISPSAERLGPTGRHIKDLLPPPRPQKKETPPSAKTPPQKKQGEEKSKTEKTETPSKKQKPAHFKEFQDLKPTKRQGGPGRFDARDRMGLRSDEESSKWRKKRPKSDKMFSSSEEIIRPTSLTIRTPITIRDLAAQMKLKASELITKLFQQGIVITLNDVLDDETTIQLLGEEFGCSLTIDTSEEERIRITNKTIAQEITDTTPDELTFRAPVVAFMGHVDHGKTSLIDRIRSTNIVAGEAGAITQHIGAFLCKTAIGNIAILDTPGHEAFSAMRARGATVTDIVVLVVAGDEGIRQQTLEAIQHAKAAGVTIVVAINKCDKPSFDVDNVYRQLSENNLLPEAWGGQTITVNCSAVTGEGIKELLEMLALQAEVLELKANPHARARGTVLESKMQKGLGSSSTLLVQNGTLRIGDPLVFDIRWARIKTMRDEFGNELKEAGPSTPVEVSGLSGLPEAGQEFIVVSNEKEARNIAHLRLEDHREKTLLQKRSLSLESLFQEKADSVKKVLCIVLRADVQGSLEALSNALQKIESDKIEVQIIFSGVGDVTEADIQLAAASKALILAFHVQVERHAEQLIKEMGVQVRSHDIIYHAVDDIKEIMTNLLDKIAQEEERGKADVRAVFRSSQHGVIAGCFVSEGSIHRNHKVRIKRGEDIIWKGSILSLRRVKEDVREVQKGVECGIVLEGTNDIREGDIIESYEITYIEQEL